AFQRTSKLDFVLYDAELSVVDGHVPADLAIELARQAADEFARQLDDLDRFGAMNLAARPGLRERNSELVGEDHETVRLLVRPVQAVGRGRADVDPKLDRAARTLDRQGRVLDIRQATAEVEPFFVGDRP